MLLLMLLTTELMLVTVNVFILLLHVNALFHCIIIDYNIIHYYCYYLLFEGIRPIL